MSFGMYQVVALMSPHLFSFFCQGIGLCLAIPRLYGFYFFLAMTGTTIFLNFVIAALITFRILYFDRYIRKTVGLEHNSPYLTVIIICVESSALIIVFSLIYLILYFKENTASLIPLQLLVHVYVRPFDQKKKGTH